MIRVLIVDDHAVVCEGAKRVLDSESDIEVVGVAGDIASALEVVGDLSPDIVLLDLELPDGNGGEAIEQFHARCPTARVLIFTSSDDEQQLADVLRRGAAGYLVKMAGLPELVSAVRSVNQGMSTITLKSMPSFREGRPQEAPTQTQRVEESPSELAALSDREREVLTQVAQGYTSKQIAEQLFLSQKTIETYRSRIMQKLAVKNRAELVQLAMQVGVLK